MLGSCLVSCNPINIIVYVGAHVLGMKYLGAAYRHCYYAKPISSNFEHVCCCYHFWFSLPIARMKFLVSLGEYDGMVDSFHTTFLAPILC